MTDVEKYILEKYGPILTTDELATVFKYKNGVEVSNAVSRETFPDKNTPFNKTMKIGSRRVANFKDVAAYIEKNYGIIQPAQPDQSDKDEYTV